MSQIPVPSFIAIYGGSSISDARLLAASGDDDLVRLVASRILARWPEQSTTTVEDALAEGRRNALRLVIEANGD